MPNKQDVLRSLKEVRVAAVIRTDNPSDLIDVGRALHAGGVIHIEITMTVPGALGVIEKAMGTLQETVCIGAGTVLDAETPRLAILAGAGYIVSPVFRPPVVDVCKRYGIAAMPGAMTPTEVLDAWEGGADVVKIFPAGVSGPQFFKDLRGPLPQIEIMPTGAVNRETAPQFIRAGACAIGVGGELVDAGLCHYYPKCSRLYSVSEASEVQVGERAMAENNKAVFFGELLMRLATPRFERFVQARQFEIAYTGAEANAAVSLVNFGTEAYVVAVVPDTEIGEACINYLRQFGVNTNFILRGGKRLGIFYLETGASQRPSKIIYDRAGSSMTELKPGTVDWEKVFRGKQWFHWSGTAPALTQLPHISGSDPAFSIT